MTHTVKALIVILTAVAAALGSFITDRTSFKAQQQDNPALVYDWYLAAARMLQSAVIAGLTAVGGLGIGEMAQ